MKWFSRSNEAQKKDEGASFWAEMVLDKIQEGVILVGQNGMISFANPAAVALLNLSKEEVVGFSFGAVVKIMDFNGAELVGAENLLYEMMKTGQNLERWRANLVVWKNQKQVPVEFNLIQAGQWKIVTMRDIAKESEEGKAQMEFISTASHEMRTPVASMEGYLSLALNPQTATIDERARGYIEAAHTAAKHLGDLFRDLLDTTKLDDGKARINLVPVEMAVEVKKIVENYVPRMNEKRIRYQFGSDSGMKTLEQVIYGAVDLEFLREIVGNLVDNAIKYTPAEGTISVNVLGEAGQVLIKVSDTGAGIAADDLPHVFQKFYRADNSDTRTVGGTGLGLYLVKKRTEAMGGRVWAESVFGQGSTFFVSLPRISSEEYERRQLALKNNFNNVNGGIK